MRSCTSSLSIATASCGRSASVGVPRSKVHWPAIVIVIVCSMTSAPERPIAISRRPQFGSRPVTMVFTSGEELTVRATRRASSVLAAPSTTTSISVCAPSPSRARSRASAIATASIAACSGPAAGWSASTASPPARPLAKSSMVSEVEVSMSMSTMLIETSATARSVARSQSRSAGASVVRKQKQVAMSGWIMPEPLAVPPTV